MNILSIETSCDETGIAIIQANPKKLSKIKILANVVASQVKLHKQYGGVYPFLAQREHKKNLPVVFKKAMKKAKSPKIDMVAVTVGPGLEPCLWMGINFAQDLAKKNNIPVVPINHIEGHILMNLIGISSQSKIKNIFPALSLLVSGGHTQLVYIKSFGDYKVIGETRDDAAGECFDKTARILGLEYPGGPIIAKKAQSLDRKSRKESESLQMPRPMMYQKNYDFSFSGLKTAVLYDHRKRSVKERSSKMYIGQMSFQIQQSIIDVLLHKTLKAAKEYKVKTVILGGGVAANKELRKQLGKRLKRELPKVQYLEPEIKFATDNGLMIAVTAYLRILFDKKRHWKKLEANANLRL